MHNEIKTEKRARGMSTLFNRKSTCMHIAIKILKEKAKKKTPRL